MPILQSLTELPEDRKGKVAFLQQQFLDYLRSGNEAGFMDLWDKTFPLKDNAADPTFSQLDFNVHIYFAVYPLQEKSGLASPQQELSRSLDSFKQFLESRGSELCKTPQYLSYYALPYVPDPKLHPSFRELFTDVWQKSLEERLFAFVGSELQAENLPVLVKLLKTTAKADADRPAVDNVNSVALSQLQDSQEQLSALMNKHRILQTDYHKLVTIASELVQALTAVLHGETITPGHLANIVQRLNAFRRDAVAAASQQQSSSQSRHAPAPSPSNAVNKRPPIAQQHLPPQAQVAEVVPSPALDAAALNAAFTSKGSWERHLNMNAVSRDLGSGKQRNSALVQALRFYVLGSHYVKFQRQAVSQLVSHDLFKRHSGLAEPLDIAAFQLSNELEDRLYKEQVVKLVNVMCSSIQGRSYFLGQTDSLNVMTVPNGDRVTDLVHEGVGIFGQKLLELMVAEMRAEHGDTVYRQNLIVALQKLSLRRAAQTVMNKLGTISWVLDLLHSNIRDANIGNELSDCSLEYAMALLMNLCLRSLGKSQCESEAGRVVKVLTDYLEHDNLQVRMYVHGSLYSILTRKALKEQAEAVGLADILEFQKSKSDDITARQIEFVLQRLYQDANEATEDSQSIVDDSQSVDGQEDDYEDDDIEADELVIDENETEQLARVYSKSSPTSFGFELLQKQYLIPVASPSKILQEPTPKPSKPLQANKPADQALYHLSRPQTPLLSRPQSALRPTPLNGMHLDDHGVVQSQVVKPRPPKHKVADKKITLDEIAKNDFSEKEVEEYYQAFSTRPKVPRTPIGRV